MALANGKRRGGSSSLKRLRLRRMLTSTRTRGSTLREAKAYPTREEISLIFARASLLTEESSVFEVLRVAADLSLLASRYLALCMATAYGSGIAS